MSDYDDFIKYAKRWGLSHEDLVEKIGTIKNTTKTPKIL